MTGANWRRWASAPFLSTASQGIGVLQLVGLLWRFGPTNATDAYLYLFNLGNLPIQILVVGVFYPMLLSEDRITRRSARRFQAWMPVVGLMAIGAGGIWLSVTDRISWSVAPILALSGLNALLQAALWCRAVVAEAGGSAIWVASIALPANLCALVLLLFPWPSSNATVTAMLVGLVLGNGALFLAAIAGKVGAEVIAGLPEVPARRHRAPWWFLAKSGTSYGGLMIIQSLSLVLPASTLTLLTVPMKIVGSVAATFVNSVMPRLVHQGTDSPDEGARFMRTMMSILVPAGLIGAMTCYFFVPDYFVMSAVVALWLPASAAAAIAQRLAFRLLLPRASRITIAVVPLLVLAVAISSRAENFGLTALLCAYATVDAATSSLLLLALRLRLMAFTTGALLAGLLAIWIGSLSA